MMARPSACSAALMPVRRRDQPLLDRIGERLRKVREARGLTQRGLAERMGVEPETISRAETGALSLSLTNLAAMARVLGMQMHDLVAAVEDPVPSASASADETELLALFHELDAAGRRVVLASVRGIAGELRRQ